MIIDNMFVVYLPQDLHEMYAGKQEYHRRMLEPFVKEIYNGISIEDQFIPDTLDVI